MGFLDFFSNNISSISLAKDVFTSGLDSATATLTKGGATIDQAADAFTADQPSPESLDVPPKAELAPAATFYEPTQYFGNYSVVDPKFQPVSSYVQDNNFLYAKEIDSFSPRLSDFVMDFGKIVTIDPSASAVGTTAAPPETIEGDSPATGEEIQQAATATSAETPVARVLSAPISRFNFSAATLTSGSGEAVMGNRIVDLTSSLDDLMQRASSIDPSTKDGQAELAQIQLDFAQAQRFLQTLSEMMDSFNQLQRTIIQNR